MLEVASGAAALGDAARRRCARGVEERICEDDVVVYAPAEVLVEGRGLFEHLFHARDAMDRPTTDVLVERLGAVEHVLHIRDAADRPAADVLVEDRGTVEHPLHGHDTVDRPTTDVLVKGAGDEEHRTTVTKQAQSGNRPSVPSPSDKW